MVGWDGASLWKGCGAFVGWVAVAVGASQFCQKFFFQTWKDFGISSHQYSNSFEEHKRSVMNPLLCTLVWWDSNNSFKTSFSYG